MSICNLQRSQVAAAPSTVNRSPCCRTIPWTVLGRATIIEVQLGSHASIRTWSHMRRLWTTKWEADKVRICPHGPSSSLVLGPCVLGALLRALLCLRATIGTLRKLPSAANMLGRDASQCQYKLVTWQYQDLQYLGSSLHALHAHEVGKPRSRFNVASTSLSHSSKPTRICR